MDMLFCLSQGSVPSPNQDPFYNMNIHGGRRPRGIYYDMIPVNSKALENLVKQGGLKTQLCNVALIPDLGETTTPIVGALRSMGITPTREDDNPDIGRSRPPYNGVRCVEASLPFDKAISLARCAGVAAVRFMSSQPNSNITAALEEASKPRETCARTPRERSGKVVGDTPPSP